MPKKEIDYSKCVIYKIQHKDNDALLYVGHTTDFIKRKCNHKTNVKCEPSSKYNLKVYQMIRENGGWDNFNMIVIKEFPCENNRQAEAEEDRIMREMKATMNTYRASHSQKEYQHQFYEKNKEKKHQYYEKNKEKYKEHSKKVCICKCGKTYTHHHKLRHEKSQFHLNFICIDTDPLLLHSLNLFLRRCYPIR